MKTRGKIQRRKVYTRYILSYISMLMISVFLGLTLIHDASGHVRSEYYAQETNRSRIIAAQFDTIMERLNSMNYLLMSNTSRITCALDPSPYNEWELVRVLSEYQSMSKTDVITFLCSANSDRIYDIAGTYTSDVFWYRRLEMRGRDDMRLEWLALEKPELLAYEDDKGQKCLMYVYPLSATSVASYDRQSFIVHYFPARLLGDLSELLVGGEVERGFVFCFEGRSVFKSSGVADEMLSTILKTNGTEDIVDTGDGYVFWQEMKYPGLRMALFVGDGNLMQTMRNYIQVLCCAIIPFVLIGIFMAVYYSRRHYEPVQQAMRLLAQDNYAGEDEFNYIISGIEGIHQNNHRITEMLHEQHGIIRQQCLMRMFNGFSVSDEELQKANIVLTDGTFAVACIRMRDNAAAAGFEMLVKEHPELLLAESDEDDMHIVLVPQVKDPASLYHMFADKVSDMDMYVGVGIHKGNASGISSAYLQAAIACEESERSHTSPVIFDSMEFHYTDSEQGNQMLACLELALQNGSEIMVNTYMETLMDTIRNMNYADGKCMRFALINLLRRISVENHLKLRPEYLLQAIQTEELDVYGEGMRAAALDLCSQKHAANEVEISRMNARLVTYMDEHFGDYDISVEKMCQFFNMSGSRLTRLVKEQTGCTPREYIIRKRMEYAGDLLNETDMSINAIGCKVGYVSVSHFIKTFKDHYGVTPSQMKANRPPRATE